MKVKCVDAHGVRGLLQVNQIYEVASESSGSYELVGVVMLPGQTQLHRWAKSRFEIVRENADLEYATTVIRRALGYDAATTPTTTDPEEDRLWQAMRPRVEPGHCVCGCPKELCDYHR